MNVFKTKRGIRVMFIAMIIVATVFAVGCWIKDIVTPYYTQITSYYCGAASAQMILASQKIHMNVDQTTLYNYIHPNNQCTGWATDPVGLKKVLNKYYPTGNFQVYALPNQEDGVKKLAYTIDKYGVPPAALIYGCQHWVVVRGVATDVQPTTSSSYTISGFWVNDPWYGSNSLGENKYITISSWKADYFTGCNWCGAAGKTYISVCDPDPLPQITLRFAEVKQRRATLITIDEVKKFAAEYLASCENQSILQKSFPDAFRNIHKVKIDTPIYVRRSDREKDGYYIVPLQLKALTTGAMIISGYSGELNEVTFVKKPIRYISKLKMEPALKTFQKNVRQIRISNELMAPEPQTKTIINKPNVINKPAVTTTKVGTVNTTLMGKLLAVKAKDLKVEKLEMVWEPSMQSQNPYYPLWEVTGTVKEMKRAGSVAFMDLNGKVFHVIEKAELKGGSSKSN